MTTDKPLLSTTVAEARISNFETLVRRMHNIFCKIVFVLVSDGYFFIKWVENVSVNFLVKLIKISSSVATDWASFHRDVVMDSLILRHEKIGEFELKNNRYFEATLTQRAG